MSIPRAQDTQLAWAIMVFHVRNSVCWSQCHKTGHHALQHTFHANTLDLVVIDPSATLRFFLSSRDGCRASHEPNIGCKARLRLVSRRRISFGGNLDAATRLCSGVCDGASLPVCKKSWRTRAVWCITFGESRFLAVDICHQKSDRTRSIAPY
jgi:hypothetical protein